MEEQNKTQETKIHYNSFKDISPEAWNNLAEKKIYFGHQSVGFNIIDGIQDLMKENPAIKLDIIETTDKAKFKKGVFAHSRVGKNVDPESKLNEFEKFLDQGIGKNTDIAFLKFCYVDVTPSTDVQKFFNDYKNRMEELQKKYPKIKLVYLTVPLTTQKETWKTKLKKLLGKDDIWEYTQNIKRNETNDLLRKEYGENEAFLDLAKIESTLPDGNRTSFTHQEITYYTLATDYTYDGGHLNETGRKKVAEQLLLLLVNL